MVQNSIIQDSQISSMNALIYGAVIQNNIMTKGTIIIGGTEIVINETGTYVNGSKYSEDKSLNLSNFSLEKFISRTGGASGTNEVIISYGCSTGECYKQHKEELLTRSIIQTSGYVTKEETANTSASIETVNMLIENDVLKKVKDIEINAVTVATKNNEGINTGNEYLLVVLMMALGLLLGVMIVRRKDVVVDDETLMNKPEDTINTLRKKYNKIFVSENGMNYLKELYGVDERVIKVIEISQEDTMKYGFGNDVIAYAMKRGIPVAVASERKEIYNYYMTKTDVLN